MKQISNKEYEEWQKYKSYKTNGRINRDYIRFVCEVCNYNAEEIGKFLLEVLGEQNGKKGTI